MFKLSDKQLNKLSQHIFYCLKKAVKKHLTYKNVKDATYKQNRIIDDVAFHKEVAFRITLNNNDIRNIIGKISEKNIHLKSRLVIYE